MSNEAPSGRAAGGVTEARVEIADEFGYSRAVVYIRGERYAGVAREHAMAERQVERLRAALTERASQEPEYWVTEVEVAPGIWEKVRMDKIQPPKPRTSAFRVVPLYRSPAPEGASE